MTDVKHNLMEQAGEALACMDYLTCETHCLAALGRARQAGDWSEYARILLPLQECRRQRRMIAAEGAIRLGTATCVGKPSRWFADRPAACVVMTHPHTLEHASHLRAVVRRLHRYIEVLFADNAPDAATWTLHAIAGPSVTCEIPAPPAAWLDQWLDTPSPIAGQTPAGWFIDATEVLGDAAIRQADKTLQSIERCLEVVTDHEILHQRLGATARAMSRQS